MLRTGQVAASAGVNIPPKMTILIGFDPSPCQISIFNYMNLYESIVNYLQLFPPIGTLKMACDEIPPFLGKPGPHQLPQSPPAARATSAVPATCRAAKCNNQDLGPNHQRFGILKENVS